MSKFEIMPEDERNKHSCGECAHWHFVMKYANAVFNQKDNIFPIVLGSCRPCHEHISMHRTDEKPCMWFKLRNCQKKK